MQIIAHRVFPDTNPIEPLATDAALPLAGVELDIRVDDAGNPVVYHAPLFLLRRHRLAQIPKSLRAAVHFLGREVPDLDLLMLDIKSARAAEAVARHLPELAPPFRLVFSCWHSGQLAILREAFPMAELHFCLVPIFTDRLSRTRFHDLYVCNAFPFVQSRRRFRPPETKTNGHSINVRLIGRDALEDLPEADGICVHRLFCKPELVEAVRAKGLRLSVYGLHANKRPLTRLAPLIDYAIVHGLGRARPGRPSSNRRSGR